MTFKLRKIDPHLEEELKAEARSSLFFALRSAFKKRSKDGVLAKDLAEALGKDPGYVSRVLSGKTGTITFETLFVFLEALKHHIPMKPVPFEDLQRTNFNARPLSMSLEGHSHGQKVELTFKGGAPIAINGGIRARQNLVHTP